MTVDDPIPSDVFTTDAAPERERFERWREAINIYFDLDKPSHLPASALNTRLESRLIDGVGFVRCDSHAQTFRRAPDRYARDGLDHYLIQLYVDGATRHRRGRAELALTAGDIAIYDLADAHHAMTSETYTNLTVIAPRRRLAPLLRAPDSQQGRRLDPQGIAFQVLRDAMLRLGAGAPRLSRRAAPAMADALINLCAAAMNEEGERPAPNECLDQSRLYRVRQFMERELHDPDLTPERIARSAGLSRAALYRLFKQQGGVRQELFRLRLRRAAAMLAAGSSRPVGASEAAYRCGFKSPAHFSRSFKQRFGESPADYRRRVGAGDLPTGAASPLPDWFRTLTS